ncbi:MAG: hypothetical protein V3U83_03860, partial [Acidobacteriota bacterium]
MIGSRRLLTAIAVLALLPLAACSKTDDQPGVRQIFGASPVITGTPIVNSTEIQLDCNQEVIDAYRFISQRDFGGFLDQNQVAADFMDLEVGMIYTELVLLVDVADEDDDKTIPGVEDILAVTATYVPPGQPDNEDSPPKQEHSLVLLDDGSQNNFSYTQIGSIDIVCDEGPPLTCRRISGFILTSNDMTANDSTFTRRIATFDIDVPLVSTVLLLQDCLALTKGQIVLNVESGESFDFRLDVVDRAG